MDKVADVLKRNWSYIVGAFLGGIGGYCYWYFIGCSSGTCPITSSPLMSTIWGSVLGSLILNLIFPSKK